MCPKIRNGKVYLSLPSTAKTIKDGFWKLTEPIYPHVIEIVTKADGTPLNPAPSPEGGRAFITKQFAIIRVECDRSAEPWRCVYNIRIFASDAGKLVMVMEKGGLLLNGRLNDIGEFTMAVNTAFALVKGQMRNLSRFEKTAAEQILNDLRRERS